MLGFALRVKYPTNIPTAKRASKAETNDTQVTIDRPCRIQIQKSVSKNVNGLSQLQVSFVARGTESELYNLL